MGHAKTVNVWKCDHCGKEEPWGKNWRSRMILHKSGWPGPWDEELVACSEDCAKSIDEKRKWKKLPDKSKGEPAIEIHGGKQRGRADALKPSRTTAGSVRTRTSLTHGIATSSNQKRSTPMNDTASAAPTYDQIVAAWNAQADDYNQWDELGEDEKIEWAVECVHAAVAQGEPLAWMDDGTLRVGSEATAYRVVTDATKRGMTASLAASFITPLYAHPAAPAAQGDAEDAALIEALERVYLWMDRQSDAQSKGGHATFDLMMLREERDAVKAAIDAARAAQGESK